MARDVKLELPAVLFYILQLPLRGRLTWLSSSQVSRCQDRDLWSASAYVWNIWLQEVVRLHRTSCVIKCQLSQERAACMGPDGWCPRCSTDAQCQRHRRVDGGPGQEHAFHSEMISVAQVSECLADLPAICLSRLASRSYCVPAFVKGSTSQPPKLNARGTGFLAHLGSVPKSLYSLDSITAQKFMESPTFSSKLARPSYIPPPRLSHSPSTISSAQSPGSLWSPPGCPGELPSSHHLAL